MAKQRVSDDAEDLLLSASNDVLKMIYKSCNGRSTTRDYYNCLEIDLNESRSLKHTVRISDIFGMYCQLALLWA